MIIDFAIVIDQQGEALVNIEGQIKSAVLDVEDGNAAMVAANNCLKSRRICQIVILLALIVVVVAVVVVVVIFVAKVS
jgi:t-SNARE complex subunit (syntaxin)